jgi:prevent-host-death family protein
MCVLDAARGIHYSSEVPKTMIVSAAEANRSFSKLLRATEEGTEVTITSHGKPKYKLVAISNQDDERQRRLEAMDKLLERLAKQEFKVVGPWTREELYERDPKV